MCSIAPLKGASDTLDFVKEKYLARAPLDPSGYFRRIPLTPERLTARVTPTADAIVLCHLGVAQLAIENWSLSIDGLVTRPLTLRFEDLVGFEKVELTAVHECAGSPLQPFEPTHRVCNLRWSGIRLRDVLRECVPLASAKFVWSFGADAGEFNNVVVNPYCKDLPLDRVDADVLLAFEMNGAPLPAEHGFPVRLVVPGFYGTNSVKWLTHITLAATRADGPFTTRWYNDPVLDEGGRATGATTPVWSIAPESLIVSPATDERVELGRETQIWGWAWADGGVSEVRVTTDAGETWRSAQLEPQRSREWQRFSSAWTPAVAGVAALGSQAIGHNGLVQPESGRRNAVYWPSVRVT